MKENTEWAFQNVPKDPGCDSCGRLKAELAAARDAHRCAKAHGDDARAERDTLRALCAAIEHKLKHGDFVQSQTANCGCDLCQALRLAVAGRGEGEK